MYPGPNHFRCLAFTFPSFALPLSFCSLLVRFCDCHIASGFRNQTFSVTSVGFPIASARFRVPWSHGFTAICPCWFLHANDAHATLAMSQLSICLLWRCAKHVPLELAAVPVSCPCKPLLLFYVRFVAASSARSSRCGYFVNCCIVTMPRRENNCIVVSCHALLSSNSIFLLPSLNSCP